MLFKIIGSNRRVKRDISDHIIDWDTKVKRGWQKKLRESSVQCKTIIETSLGITCSK